MRSQLRLVAVGAVGVAVGLLAAGTSASTLLVLALVLACPIMMMFMMGGMGHGEAGHRPPRKADQDQQVTHDQRWP